LEKEETFGKELEQVYKKALTLAGANDTLLRENQRSWLKYQESGCKLDELFGAVPGNRDSASRAEMVDGLSPWLDHKGI
jgi:uncharacterized protein YecT (DUF1311 family)